MPTPKNKSLVEHPSDREIVSTRVFAARREAMFDAFGDPKQLARWWGPKGFTNTFEKFDLRPGGHWRFVMQGPDGARYESANAFVEITKPERIVFQHLQSGHNFQMTMTWTEESGQTRLTWRMRFESAAECAPVRSFIVAANEENFDRLAAHLAGMT